MLRLIKSHIACPNSSRVFTLAFACLLLSGFFASEIANAQSISSGVPGASTTAAAAAWRSRPLAANVVVPQWRSFQPAVRHGAHGRGQVVITRVDVLVDITEQIATTTLDISLKNTGRQRLETELLVPVPDKAVVRGFDFQGKGSEPSAQLLRRDEARKIYDSIVSKMRDPALLEFIDYNLVRSSVFPVEPLGTQKVRLRYEQVLIADGARVDYVLPRSESVHYNVPWHVTVNVKAKKPISTIFSPSHKIDTKRGNSKQIVVRIAPDAVKETGAFRLSYLVEQAGVTASMFAYPDPKSGGGYFLMLAGLPAKPKDYEKNSGIKREVTLVIDHSGSMNGEKLAQVQEAALQVVAGLNDGEAFNIILYNEAVELFATQPVIKDDETYKAARAYIKAIKARGGTNIHDAILEAVRPKPHKGMLPIVLFLTDGLPTVGQTSEKSIRDTAIKGNRYERRIFTFGVGADVNTPLLEKISFETRGTPTFVMPKEDVELKVAKVFKRLAGPVLAGTEVAAMNKDGKPAHGRVMDMLPTKLPDLFDGDQLVLLGRYVGDQPIGFKIKGNFLGKNKAFSFTFKPAKATTRNAYVPRLWASRRIADLIDQIRTMGADTGGYGQAPGAATPGDPKLKELIDDVVRLSLEFGILTEYTAFLAREGTDLSKKGLVLSQTHRNFVDRAWNVRSGVGSLNQDFNNNGLKSQLYLNGGNKYFDAKMNRVSIANVQQVNDKAFYKRGNQWIDAELAVSNKNDAIKPDKVIAFDTPAYQTLVRTLAGQNRCGTIALQGDILMVVNGQRILVKCSSHQTDAAAAKDANTPNANVRETPSK
jgi:Ca-activated chloride channel homolog